MKPTSRTPAFFFAVALLLIIAGCDSDATVDDLVFLNQSTAFTFEFNPSTIQGGEVAWNGSPVLLGPNVPGFSKDQIGTVEIEEVEATRLQPSTLDLAALLDGATLTLEAAGSSPVTVVRFTAAGSTGTADELTYEAVSGANIAPLLRQSAATARLAFRSGVTLPQASLVRIRVSLAMQIGYTG